LAAIRRTPLGCIAWFGLLGLSLAALPHSSVTVALDHGQHLQTI
jgi:hypothetical protein